MRVASVWVPRRVSVILVVELYSEEDTPEGRGTQLDNNIICRTQNVRGLDTTSTPADRWFQLMKQRKKNGILDVLFLQETHVSAATVGKYDYMYAGLGATSEVTGKDNLRSGDSANERKAGWESSLTRTRD